MVHHEMSVGYSDGLVAQCVSELDSTRGAHVKRLYRTSLVLMATDSQVNVVALYH